MSVEKVLCRRYSILSLQSQFGQQSGKIFFLCVCCLKLIKIIHRFIYRREEGDEGFAFAFLPLISDPGEAEKNQVCKLTFVSLLFYNLPNDLFPSSSTL